MSEDDKDKELQHLNPQMVLNNLAEYVNTRELPNPRIDMIKQRFMTLEEFKVFKDEVLADEERKQAELDMKKQLRQIFGKMQDLDAVQLNLENDLATLRADVRTKATNNKVNHIEEIMEDFATRSDIHRLLNKMDAYTTLDQFNKRNIQMDRQNNGMIEAQSTLVLKSELALEVEKMQDYVHEVNKTNSQKRDCAKDVKEMMSLFEKIKKDFLNLRDDHANSKERIGISETLIDMKAQDKEFKEVKGHLELLPTKDQILEMKDYMNTNIDEFKG